MRVANPGEALREAIMACRRGGVLSMLGMYGLMDKVPMGVIMNRGMAMRSAQQHGQAYMDRLLAHAQKGELNPAYLATHRFPLEDAPRGYDMSKRKTDGCARGVRAVTPKGERAMADGTLNGLKVAILVTDGFEQMGARGQSQAAA